MEKPHPIKELRGEEMTDALCKSLLIEENNLKPLGKTSIFVVEAPGYKLRWTIKRRIMNVIRKKYHLLKAISLSNV